jgi:hypothetical protein
MQATQGEPLVTDPTPSPLLSQWRDSMGNLNVETDYEKIMAHAAEIQTGESEE